MAGKWEARKSQHCIVIADEPSPQWVAYDALDLRPAPVQYRSLGGSATLLHLALHRAASIAPTSQILVTALEEYRYLWEPTLWCVRPEMRFLGDKRTNPLFTSAAAILSIARVSPSSIVTILPARCYVRHEWVLRQALRQVAAELPHIPEGVATLGMLDIDEGVDEDYMVLCRAPSGRGFAVQGMAHRPTAWVARHLRRQGAVVSSGIMIGYAERFATHIARVWRGIHPRLTTQVAMASAARRECEVTNNLQERVPSAVLKSLRWRPPAFPQRVFTVSDSGWSGLKSPQAVIRIAEFVSNRFDGPARWIKPQSVPDHGEPMAV
jgi:mannose-1-phosphate guanylyltransferase